MLSGRSGNDVASGLVVILDRMVQDNPGITSVTPWSDLHVPQNRNKVMSTALMFFLKRTPSLQSITQKFCEPGHSKVQKIDNLHSQTDRVAQLSEIYSHVGLVRLLSRTPRQKPLKLVQLRKADMTDYHSEANTFQFSGIPFHCPSSSCSTNPELQILLTCSGCVHKHFWYCSVSSIHSIS